MKEIVIATKNKHKFFEIVAIMSNIKCKFLFAGDFPELPDIEETGDTLLENALLKAQKTSLFFNKTCIAEDTGFFVKKLEGRPGIYSSRYSGACCCEKANRKKILSELGNTKDREAYFATVAVLYHPIKGLLKKSEGKVLGQVLITEKGENGFGYDSIFVPIHHEKTYAEMHDLEKNMMSHRYLAMIGLIDTIKYLD